MAAKKTPSESITVLSGLAQELNAPLKSVLLRTEKLIQDYKTRNFEYISFKDFKNIISNLENIKVQVERCSSTIDKMLLVEKKRASISEGSVDLNELINQVLNGVEQKLELSKIKLQLRLSKALPKVSLGQIECEQVVYNIIMNAVQSMPSGGNLRIKTMDVKEKNQVFLEVIDDGVGISPEHLSKVYEPFFTTKERGVEKSAGLGLSVVNSIIQQGGGMIEIKSSLRKGTVVQVSLPQYKNK